jgi:hypothetical protein
MATTRQQAQDALDWLRTELVDDFPFATRNDEARFITYLLTASARELITACPFFLFTGADRHSGTSAAAAVGRATAGDPANVTEISGRSHDQRADERRIAKAVATRTRFVHLPEAGDTCASVVVSTAINAGEGEQYLRISGGSTAAAITGLVFTGEGVDTEPAGALAGQTFVIRFAVAPGQLRWSERTDLRHPDIVRWVEEHRRDVVLRIATILQYGFENPVLPSAGLTFGDFYPVILAALTHVMIDGTTVCARLVGE